MITLLLVIHIFLALGLIIVVLLQRSEGGALGIGGGSGGLMTGRAQANLLTRTTAVLAALFMANSLLLAVLAGADRQPRSIFDEAPASAPVAPPVAPAAPGQGGASPDTPEPAAPAPSSPAAPPTR